MRITPSHRTAPAYPILAAALAGAAALAFSGCVCQNCGGSGLVPVPEKEGSFTGFKGTVTKETQYCLKCEGTGKIMPKWLVVEHPRYPDMRHFIGEE